MPSIHESIMRRGGVPSLMRSHAERDDKGKPAYLKYWNPTTQSWSSLEYIAGEVATQEELDPSDPGRVTKRETLTVQVRSGDLAEIGVTRAQRQAIVELPSGVQYHIDLGASKFGGALATLGLERNPLTQDTIVQRADI